jgi:hypothetical protein
MRRMTHAMILRYLFLTIFVDPILSTILESILATTLEMLGVRGLEATVAMTMGIA